jgi:hypothetical protein
MPAKLILSMDGAVLKEYPLNKERTTIGRKPHNDIVIDNLAVSSEHAAIVTILNDSFLETWTAPTAWPSTVPRPRNTFCRTMT